MAIRRRPSRWPCAPRRAPPRRPARRGAEPQVEQLAEAGRALEQHVLGHNADVERRRGAGRAARRRRAERREVAGRTAPTSAGRRRPRAARPPAGRPPRAGRGPRPAARHGLAGEADRLTRPPGLADLAPRAAQSWPSASLEEELAVGLAQARRRRAGRRPAGPRRRRRGGAAPTTAPGIVEAADEGRAPAGATVRHAGAFVDERLVQPVEVDGEADGRDGPVEGGQQAVVAAAVGHRQVDARRVGFDHDAGVVVEVLHEAEVEGHAGRRSRRRRPGPAPRTRRSTTSSMPVAARPACGPAARAPLPGDRSRARCRARAPSSPIAVPRDDRSRAARSRGRPGPRRCRRCLRAAAPGRRRARGGRPRCRSPGESRAGRWPRARRTAARPPRRRPPAEPSPSSSAPSCTNSPVAAVRRPRCGRSEPRRPGAAAAGSSSQRSAASAADGGRHVGAQHELAALLVVAGESPTTAAATSGALDGLGILERRGTHLAVAVGGEPARSTICSIARSSAASGGNTSRMPSGITAVRPPIRGRRRQAVALETPVYALPGRLETSCRCDGASRDQRRCGRADRGRRRAGRP